MFITLTDIRYETPNDRKRPRKKIPNTMSLEKLASLIKKGQKFYERVGINEIHVGYSVAENGKEIARGVYPLSHFGDVESDPPLKMLQNLRSMVGDNWYDCQRDPRHQDEIIDCGYKAEFGRP